MRIMQLAWLRRFASAIDRCVCAAEMGECGGVSVSIEYLRNPNTRGPASPYRPIAGTDGCTEAVRYDIRSYCRGKAEFLVRSDTLALSSSP